MVLVDKKKFEPEMAQKLEQLAEDVLASNATVKSVSGRRLLDTMSSHLWERELAVLTKRYALDGGKPLSLEETSAKLGVSKERISEIQAQAFVKLARPKVMQFFSSKRTTVK